MPGHVLGDGATLDIDRVGDQLAGQRQPDRSRHRDAGRSCASAVDAPRWGCDDDAVEEWNSGESVHGSLANVGSGPRHPVPP